MNPESGLQAAIHKQLNLDILILTRLFPVGPVVGRQVQWDDFFEKRCRKIPLVCDIAE